MADRYWVGGTASWDGTAGTKWATTSGGTGGAAIPTSGDDVYFDANSGANTVTIATGNTGAKSISCTSVAGNFTGTLTGTAGITVSGSVTLVSGMTFSYTGTLLLNATGTITSAGKTFGVVTVSGSGITVTLGDSFVSSGTVTLTQGTFNANNYNFTAAAFNSNNTNPRTITMGSGLWTLTGTGTIWTTSTTTNLTFNKNTADILLSDNSTTTRTFNSGSLTFNKLTIGGNTSTSQTNINGNPTLSELASTKTVAHTIQTNSGMSVATWSITGTSGNVVTIQSSVPGAARTFTKTGGGFFTNIDYLNVRDMIGSPTDTWYIGSNSVINATAPNGGYNVFTTQRASNAVIILTDATGTATWTVPSDWNNSSNTIQNV